MRLHTQSRRSPSHSSFFKGMNHYAEGRFLRKKISSHITKQQQYDNIPSEEIKTIKRSPVPNPWRLGLLQNRFLTSGAPTHRVALKESEISAELHFVCCFMQ